MSGRGESHSAIKYTAWSHQWILTVDELRWCKQSSWLTPLTQPLLFWFSVPYSLSSTTCTWKCAVPKPWWLVSGLYLLGKEREVCSSCGATMMTPANCPGRLSMWAPDACQLIPFNGANLERLILRGGEGVFLPLNARDQKYLKYPSFKYCVHFTNWASLIWKCKIWSF